MKNEKLNKIEAQGIYTILNVFRFACFVFRNCFTMIYLAICV